MRSPVSFGSNPFDFPRRLNFVLWNGLAIIVSWHFYSIKSTHIYFQRPPKGTYRPEGSFTIWDIVSHKCHLLFQQICFMARRRHKSRHKAPVPPLPFLDKAGIWGHHLFSEFGRWGCMLGTCEQQLASLSLSVCLCWQPMASSVTAAAPLRCFLSLWHSEVLFMLGN